MIPTNLPKSETETLDIVSGDKENHRTLQEYGSVTLGGDMHINDPLKRTRNDSLKPVGYELKSQSTVRNVLRRIPSSYNLAQEIALAEISITDDIPSIPDEVEADEPFETTDSESDDAECRARIFIGPPKPCGPWLRIPQHLYELLGIQSLTRNGIIPERLCPGKALPPIIEPGYTDELATRIEMAERHASPLDISVKDLTAEVCMYEKYYEFWDIKDEETLIIPGRLLLTMKTSNIELATLMPTEPDLRLLDIQCQSFTYPGAHRQASHRPDIHVGYNEMSSVGSHDFGLGVCIRPTWRKICSNLGYRVPRKHTGAKGRQAFEAERKKRKSPLYGNEDSECDEDDEEAPKLFDPALEKDGWYMKFWIPIPLEYLRREGTKAFRVQAAAWIGDAESGGIVIGDADFVVSIPAL